MRLPLQKIRQCNPKLNQASVILTQDHFIRNRVSHNSSSETDSGRTLAGGIYSTGRDLRNVLEKLRLGHTRITHETNINVSPNLHPVSYCLRNTSDKEKEQSLFHILVAVDFRRYTLSKTSIEVGILLQRDELSVDFWSNLHFGVLLLDLMNVVDFEIGIGEKTRADGLEARVWCW